MCDLPVPMVTKGRSPSWYCHVIACALLGLAASFCHAGRGTSRPARTTSEGGAGPRTTGTVDTTAARSCRGESNACEGAPDEELPAQRVPARGNTPSGRCPGEDHAGARDAAGRDEGGRGM